MKALIAAMVVGVLLALLFLPWVAVPAFNPHEGAVAYTIPVFKTHTLPVDSTGTRVPLTGTGRAADRLLSMSIDVFFPVTKYTKPTDVYKSPWDIWFSSPGATKAAQLLVGDGGGAGGQTCTTSESDFTETDSIRTQITATRPDGTTERWVSSPKAVGIPIREFTKVCLGLGSGTTYTWAIDQDIVVDWPVGTYYMKQTGNYRVETMVINAKTAQPIGVTNQVLTGVGI